MKGLQKLFDELTWPKVLALVGILLFALAQTIEYERLESGAAVFLFAAFVWHILSNDEKTEE